MMKQERAPELLVRCLADRNERMAHSIAVAGYAGQIAQGLKDEGYDVDLGHTKVVGLLHDIGHGFTDMPGSIEEHALLELAYLQKSGFPLTGWGAARDFATHEGLSYSADAVRRGEDIELPINPRQAQFLIEAGLPIEGALIGYINLLAAIEFPDDPSRNLHDNLARALATKLLIPDNFAEAAVSYADIHLQQGRQPYHDEKNVLKVQLPDGSCWGVAYGSFSERIAEIKSRFRGRNDANSKKILSCVLASEKRLRELIVGVNMALGLSVDSEVFLEPEPKDYRLDSVFQKN